MDDNTNKLVVMYPYLQKINDRFKGELHRVVIYRKYEAGQVIKTDNTECSNILLVLEGRIKIEKLHEDGNETWIYELGPGEICHDTLACYMKCEPLNLTAYALSDLLIGLIPIKEVTKYLINDVDFLTFLYTNLYDKFRKAILDKEERIHESVYDRLTKYLKSKNTSIIYTTHQEIALELGTAREVVSRNLKIMEKKGFIELQRNKIRLRKF